PATQASQPIEEEPAESERPRFGIGSLINRMSGAETGREAASARRQPQVQSDKAQEASDDPQDDPSSPGKDRIEVPAFLRRQAN
ncbi:MAG: cell division protein FtsZ, partial [Marinovum sp.]|nr:cell division protein FtsZ [Marinovum sp.]